MRNKRGLKNLLFAVKATLHNKNSSKSEPIKRKQQPKDEWSTSPWQSHNHQDARQEVFATRQAPRLPSTLQWLVLSCRDRLVYNWPPALSQTATYGWQILGNLPVNPSFFDFCQPLLQQTKSPPV
jgi:hypothetical protein